MTSTNYETIDLAKLKQYETFDTTADMDAKIYEYIEVLRNDEQPESVIEVLRFLGRSSLRITGVSFAKHQTIADSIGISRRTVIRAMNKLADYGMIERIPTVKKWIGRSRKKSVNIIVIQAAIPSMSHKDDTTEEAEEVTQDKLDNAEQETEPSLHNHTSNNYLLETAKAVKNAIPTPIYTALSPFFNAKELRRLTGVIFRGKYMPHAKVRIEDHADAFTDVLLDVIRRYKDRTINNLDGYLYAAIRKLSRRLYLTI